jgi:hypothetical protein
MEETNVIATSAQVIWLDVVRMLVEVGAAGLPAGQIGKRLDLLAMRAS